MKEVWNDCPICGKELIFNGFNWDNVAYLAFEVFTCPTKINDEIHSSHYSIDFVTEEEIEQEYFMNNDFAFARTDEGISIRLLNSHHWFSLNAHLDLEKIIKMTIKDFDKLRALI